MAWFALLMAGFLEVAWSYSMKLSNGFKAPIPTVITLITMIASFVLLAYTMRSLPLGTAYVIWTGIGAVGAFLVGFIFLHEPMSWLRGLAACLIITGMVLMKLTSQT